MRLCRLRSHMSSTPLWGVLCVGALVCVALLLMASIVVFSLCERDLTSGSLVQWVGFKRGLNNFIYFWHNSVIYYTLLKTLASFFLTVTMLFVLAYLTSWLLFCQTVVVRYFILSLLVWPLFFPSLFVGYAVLISFEPFVFFCLKNGFDIALVVMGSIYIYWPYLFFPVYIGVNQIPSHYIHAARDLGSGWMRMLLSVVIPMSRRAAMMGLYAVTPILLLDIVAPLILTGGAGDYLGNYVWSAIFSDVNLPVVSVVGVYIFVVYLLLYVMGRAVVWLRKVL